MRCESFPLGLVLERRRVDHPWQDHAWRPAAVIPGDPEGEPWRVLREGDGWIHYFAGTLDLELYPKETDGYRINLSQPAPFKKRKRKPYDPRKGGFDQGRGGGHG